MYGDLSENLLKDFEAERVKGEILIAHNPSPREFFSSTHGLLGLLQVAVTRDTKYSQFGMEVPYTCMLKVPVNGLHSKKSVTVI